TQARQAPATAANGPGPDPHNRATPPRPARQDRLTGRHRRERPAADMWLSCGRRVWSPPGPALDAGTSHYARPAGTPAGRHRPQLTCSRPAVTARPAQPARPAATPPKKPSQRESDAAAAPARRPAQPRTAHPLRRPAPSTPAPGVAPGHPPRPAAFATP